MSSDRSRAVEYALMVHMPHTGNSTAPALLCVDYKDPASNGCWRIKKARDDKGILYRYYDKNGQVVFTERVDSMGQ